jgi:hypothetical protein
MSVLLIFIRLFITVTKYLFCCEQNNFREEILFGFIVSTHHGSVGVLVAGNREGECVHE